MSLASLFGSRAAAAPLPLYTFARGAQVWRFAPTLRGFTVPAGLLGAEAVEFAPRGVVHAGFTHGARAGADPVRLRFPISDPFAADFLQPLGDRRTTVLIHQVAADDPGAGILSAWRGRVVGAEAEEETIALVAEAAASRLARSGRRPVWSRRCAHVHYAPGCGLNVEDWLEAASVTAITGDAATIPALAADPARWRAGVLRFGEEWRLLREVGAGGIARLGAAFPALAAEVTAEGSAAVQVAPGCDRSAGACEGFGNIAQRLAFDHLLGGNPFEDGIG